jgi:hypothetical protein
MELRYYFAEAPYRSYEMGSAASSCRAEGQDCRATRMVRSHRGVIARSEGIIQHDIDNLGRRLISVQWDYQ